MSEAEFSSSLAILSPESFQKLEADFTFLRELVVKLSAALLRAISQDQCRVTETDRLLHDAEECFRYAKNPSLTEALSADLQAAGYRALEKAIKTEKEIQGNAPRFRNSDEDAKELSAGKLKLLTPREMAIFTEIVAGASRKQTARNLSISPRTVDAHRANILQKLGAKNTVGLLHIVWTR